MAYATSHNGGKTQIGLNKTAEQFAFLDYMKASSQEWVNRLAPNQNWFVDPSTRDANGQPATVIQAGGYYSKCKVPSSSARSNNYVLLWDGAGTVLHPVTAAGTTTGNGGGRIAFSPAANANFAREIFLTVTASSTTPNHVRNMRVCHADDEATLLAGTTFSQQAFRDKITLSGAGVIRFMDFWDCNISQITKFTDLKPTGYWSWFISEWRQAFIPATGMTTAGAGAAFTLAFSGFVLADKSIVQVFFDRDQAGACTLNVNSTGAKNIIAHNCSALSSGGNSLVTGNISDSNATLIYDAALDAWIKTGGDVAFRSKGFINGVPLDVMLQLCAETGCHPYFTIPWLTDEPNTFASDLAVYVKNWIISNNVSWMIPWYEAQNEIFNNGAGFHARGYAEQRQGVLNGETRTAGVRTQPTYNVSAVAVNGSDAAKTDVTFTGAHTFIVGSNLVGASFGGMSGWSSFTAYVTAINVSGNANKITVDKLYAGTYTSGGTCTPNANSFEEWYGMQLSKIGQAVSAAYSNDRTKYKVICGVQTNNGYTTGGANNSAPRLEARSYVLRGGSAAYSWTTAIAPAQYFHPANYNVAAETTAIASWAAAQAAVTISGTSLTVNSYTTGSSLAGMELSGYGLVFGTKVVSGTSPNYTIDISQTYTGTVYGGDPTTRRTLEKTYVLTNLTGSTGFSLPEELVAYPIWATWAAAYGVMEMVGYEGGYSPDFPSSSGATLTAQFREATKRCPELTKHLRTMYKEFCGQGTTVVYPNGFTAHYPSCYFFIGNNPSDYVWAILNDVSQAETPQFAAIRLFNNNKRRYFLRT